MIIWINKMIFLSSFYQWCKKYCDDAKFMFYITFLYICWNKFPKKRGKNSLIIFFISLMNNNVLFTKPFSWNWITQMNVKKCYTIGKKQTQRPLQQLFIFRTPLFFSTKCVIHFVLFKLVKQIDFYHDK